MAAGMVRGERGIVLTTQDWHRRYLQQAAWTSIVRQHIFSQVALHPGAAILEVGCGTGAVLQDLPVPKETFIFGLDFNFKYLSAAASASEKAHLTCADAYAIPFPDHTFAVCFCHFFLLWVNDPIAVLAEMKRVTQLGGMILALAEPDYGSRIDHPADLQGLGQLQASALQRQGADSTLGRKLPGLFRQAGLSQVSGGIIGAEFGLPFDPGAWNEEWLVLTNDLAGFLPESQLAELQNKDHHAWLNGERVLFVPTFYAAGVVAESK